MSRILCLAIILGSIGSGQFQPSEDVENATHSVSFLSAKKTEAGAYNVALEIVSKRTGEKRTGYLLEEINRIDSLKLAAGRLLVFAHRARATVIMIVDLDLAEQIDTIYCYQPVLSPNERYIAYVRFYPPYGMLESRSALLLAYDLDSSPVANRIGRKTQERYERWVTAEPMSSAGPTLGMNVGHILYPEENRAKRSYEVRVPDQDRRLRFDSIQWSADSETLSFREWQGEYEWHVSLSLSPDLAAVVATRNRMSPEN